MSESEVVSSPACSPEPADLALPATLRQDVGRAAPSPWRSTATSTLKFVASSPFANVEPEAVTAMAKASVRRSFGAHEFIYLQDDRANCLYFVVSGHVRLSYLMEDGSVILHALLPPGESFGELGVFDDGTYADMATASGPLVLACVPVAAFWKASKAYPSLSNALSRAVARRYRAYVLLTRDLSLKTLSARLAQALMRLADGLGKETRYRGRTVKCIGSMVTQTDLGLMARGSRGNVNRALKSWERAGLIAFADREIMLLDREGLESLSLDEGI